MEILNAVLYCSRIFPLVASTKLIIKITDMMSVNDRDLNIRGWTIG